MIEMQCQVLTKYYRKRNTKSTLDRLNIIYYRKTDVSLNNLKRKKFRKREENIIRTREKYSRQYIVKEVKDASIDIDDRLVLQLDTKRKNRIIDVEGNRSTTKKMICNNIDQM